MVSPPMPSGSRLVAIRWTLGHLNKMALATSAHASIRCSQLSSTMSTDWSSRALSKVSSTGRSARLLIPSTSLIADGMAPCSETEASSTSQTPSPEPSSSSAATCRPSRVLPHPPAPVRETSRADSTRRRTSATSTSRPTKLRRLRRQVVRKRRVVERAQ